MQRSELLITIFNSTIVFRKAGLKRYRIKTCWNFVPPILRVSTFEIDFIYRIGLQGYKKSMSIVRSIVLLPVAGADFSAGVPQPTVFFFFFQENRWITSPVSKLLHQDFSFLLFFTIKGVLILILLILSFFFRYRRKIIGIHRHENRSKK